MPDNMSELSPTSRHSFRKSAVAQAAGMPTNAYGQTVLGDNPSQSPAEIESVQVNQEGGLEIQTNLDIFDSPHLQEWARSAGVGLDEILSESPATEETVEQIPAEITLTKPILASSAVSEEKPSRIMRTMSPANNNEQTTCINESCNAILPSGARFCSQCGKPQLGKHCIQCGYHFGDREKFCPECGSQR